MLQKPSQNALSIATYETLLINVIKFNNLLQVGQLKKELKALKLIPVSRQRIEPKLVGCGLSSVGRVSPDL